MKQLLLLFILVLMVAAGNAQVVYVDATATGTADGSSWDNAYTDLTMALDSADTGSSLWIAAGTYVTPDSSAFYIDRQLSLYGGFAGNETEASAANPTVNETILSGDVLGNDMEGAFDSLLMSDNNRVFLIIDTAETSQFTVTLDGFTIRDGAIADDFVEGSLLPFAGGGLYSEARVNVSRVTFTANRAPFGAASTLIFGTTGGSTFDSIQSYGNYTDIESDFYFRLSDSISISNSSFTGTTDSVGSGLISAVSLDGFFVSNSSFEGQSAMGGRGGAINTSNVLGHRITNCTFDALSADLGGALYLRNSNDFKPDSLMADAMDCVIDSCTFTDVESLRWGGAIFFGNLSHTITNSTFTDGIGAQTAGLGGAVYAQAGDTLMYEYMQDGNAYTRNSAGGSGGALFYFADNVEVMISNTSFTDNLTQSSGGALNIQGASEDTVTMTHLMNCEFTGNSSPGFAAAAIFLAEDVRIYGTTFAENSAVNGSLYLGSGGKTFHVSNSIFENNGNPTSTAFSRGAGIWGGLSGGDNPDSIIIDSTIFRNNVVTSDDFISGGSAIYLSGDSGMVPGVRVLNSIFTGNATTDQADGTIEAVNGVDLTVVNCDFLSNNSAGAGGAISVTRTSTLDTLDGVPFRYYNTDDEPSLTVERSLFVNNIAGSQGGAINLFSASISMTNSLLIGNSISDGGGSGGALIINGSDVLGAELDNYLINNTFYNNVDGGRADVDTTTVAAGNAVALFQPGNTLADTNSLVLTIQNNAFFQLGADQEAIGIEYNVGDAADVTGVGALSVVSLGGNFFNSNLEGSFDFDTLAGVSDIVNTTIDVETIFKDPNENDLNSDYPDLDLVSNGGNNPLVDGGTTGPLVPEVDFFNAERDLLPDIGAIEIDTMRTDVAEPIQDSGLELTFFPNPTTDVVNIVNNDPSVGRFTVLVSDMQGRFLSGRQFSAASNTLNLSTLPKGVYNLSLLINGKVYSKQVVKQ